MLKPIILVTGATGKAGRLIVAQLLKASYPRLEHDDARPAELLASRA
jgi:uncharacterized protein YbjT (DUF2867 family)